MVLALGTAEQTALDQRKSMASDSRMETFTKLSRLAFMKLKFFVNAARQTCITICVASSAIAPVPRWYGTERFRLDGLWAGLGRRYRKRLGHPTRLGSCSLRLRTI